MTVEAFKTMMQCNEPTFTFRGVDYTICQPLDVFYAYESDDAEGTEKAFATIDELISSWTLRGVPFLDALPHIM
ncbi:MAG: hypothetical protein RSF86_14890 [Angelakisella sp.]